MTLSIGVYKDMKMMNKLFTAIALLSFTATSVAGMARITINGVTYEGENLIINNNSGHIQIDNQIISISNRIININVSGDLNVLEVSSANTIEIIGNAGEVNTASGNIQVDKVLGNANSVSGSIYANDIIGNVSTISGSVNYK